MAPFPTGVGTKDRSGRKAEIRSGQQRAATARASRALAAGRPLERVERGSHGGRLADPAPFVKLQHRFAREYTDALVRNGATLARTMHRTVDETLRPLEGQIERQRRDQANQNDVRIQTEVE